MTVAGARSRVFSFFSVSYMDIAKQLSHIPLFQGLEPEHLKSLARIAVKKAFKRGETVFAEGDPGTGFYIITTGRVKVFKSSPDGKNNCAHHEPG